MASLSLNIWSVRELNNSIISIITETIAGGLVESLKSGELEVDDNMSTSFFFTCIGNVECIPFLAYVIAQHYDLDAKDLESYMTLLYKKGEKDVKGDNDE